MANVTVDNNDLTDIEVSMGAGNVEASKTQRVTIATDDNNLAAMKTNLATLAGAVSGTELQVDIVSGGGTGGTAETDDGAFTAGSGSGTPIMGFVSADTVDSGDVGVVAMSTDRRLHVDAQIVGQDADVTIADGGNSITVDGTITANLSATDNAVLDQIDANTDFGAVTGGGTETGALRVTLANNSTGVLSVDDNGGSLTVDGTVAATQSGTWNVNNVSGTVSLPTGAATAANQSTANTALSAIQTAVQTLDNAISGNEMQVDVVAALPAGTNLIGNVGIGVRTSGGTSIFRSIDLDESEEQIKATAGQVYWIHAMNLSASTKFLKFYNATAASVTVGTTTPVLTIPLATQGDTNGAGFTLSIPNGIAFSTAITVAATTGIADADTGAPGANEVVVNIGYA